MTILLLSPAYYPDIHPRAHRWTALAEYWAGQGHRVIVVCARKRGFPVLEDIRGVQVFRCGFESLQSILYYAWPSVRRRGRVGERPARAGIIRQIMEWAYQNIWKRLYFPDDALFWISPAVRMGRYLIQQEKPDMLITVSLPFSAHVAGYRLKEQFSDLYWMADTGDPYAIQSPPLINWYLYGRRAETLEKKVLETADSVVVTNHALREVLIRRYQLSHPERIRIIPPLLWPAPPREPYIPDPEKIRLVFAGALYAGLREPADCIQWLENLLDNKPDWQERLELHWYGEVTPAFYKELASRPWVYLHGLCTREEVQHALATADVLVNIGNKSTFQLPSKMVDYLATGRPVLHFQYVDRDPVIDFWPLETTLFIIRNNDPEASALEKAVRFIEKARKEASAEIASDQWKEYLPCKLGMLYLEG